MTRLRNAAAAALAFSAFVGAGLSGPQDLRLAPLAHAETATRAAPEAVDPQEAAAIAVQAYLYFYPLVTMDLTRRQLISLDPKENAFGGEMNWFTNARAYPTGKDRAVVRPNFDTLYSSAFLDLTEEPVVLSLPDTDGRYYLMQMLDMWSDVFAAPGWRTTGTEAQHILISPPDWHEAMLDEAVTKYGLPADLQRVTSPTRHAWIIGRTKTDGPADYPAVHKIQDGYLITPLSKWGQPPKAPPFAPDPTVNVKIPPKEQVDAMAGADFFRYAAEILKTEPPHLTDEPILARMARIGLVAGESYSADQAAPAIRKAIEAAPAAAQKLMAWKQPKLGWVENNWAMNTDTVGVYGNYYLKRAIFTQIGLGANSPEDAIYPIVLGDAEGAPLDGSKSGYALHFAKDDLPPVNAFWSVTLYDDEGYQVPNELNRFALSSWMDLERNPDGSLDLYFQPESPGEAKAANWLPAPAGPFNLTMRLYAPKAEVVNGAWAPPAVARTK